MELALGMTLGLGLGSKLGLAVAWGLKLESELVLGLELGAELEGLGVVKVCEIAMALAGSPAIWVLKALRKLSAIAVVGKRRSLGLICLELTWNSICF